MICLLLTEQGPHPPAENGVLCPAAFAEMAGVFFCPGHGSPADCVERRGSAGVLGHHSGTVDLPAGVAALWRPDVTGAGCFCVVKTSTKSLIEDY